MINERILIGSAESPSYTFDENSIESITCENSIGLTGGEMSADVLEVGVFFNDPTEQFANLAYSTPIYYYSNGRAVGKYYVLSVEQKGVNRYLIRATSLIGIIERDKFYGGMYNAQAFSTVMNDVLFGNGVSPNVDIYEAKNNGTVYPVKLSSITASNDQFKYRMKVKFTVVDVTSSGAFTILAGTNAGSSSQYKYNIELDSSSSSGGSTYYYVVVRYGLGYTYLFSNLNAGAGSTFDIDIDPSAGKIRATAEYINCDDPSVTGTAYEEKSISVVTSSTNVIDLTYAFGGTMYYSDTQTVGSAASGYRYTIIWDSHEVYDEDGNLLVKAAYVRRGSDNYILNFATSEFVPVTNWNSSGGLIASVGDISMLSRAEEFYNSVQYADGVANLPVSGWIPIGTRREALHQLLFSQGISMVHSADGGIILTPLSTAVTGEIDDDNLYSNGSEERLQQAKTVSVTEHTFSTPSGNAATLFDNSSTVLRAGEYIVEFQGAPVYGTPTASGGITIKSYNCNAAVVEGRGVITGTPYVHSENVISYLNGNVSDGADVSVADATLVSSLNSDNVLNRLKAYYCADVRKTNIGIRFNGERCGAVYSFTSPLLQSINAFLTKYTSRASSFVKSDCEFVRGFNPQKSGGYSSFAIVPYGESFTIPDSVKQEPSPTIRLNIIGAGSSGSVGANGEAGGVIETQSGYSSSGGKGGAGGNGGAGGAGGNVVSYTVDATNLTTVSVESSGSNTIAKTYNGSSLVTSYSSASGTPQSGGFVNAFTGVAYALPGNKGIDGGNGGDGGYVEQEGSAVGQVLGTNGGGAGNYSGGLTFSGDFESSDFFIEWHTYGGGGGASANANGGDAHGVPSRTYGGDGADAGLPTPTTPTYGCGGNGGNGGGGGGGCGVYVFEENVEGGSVTTYPQQIGGGGRGGAGSAGNPGCVIIYY